jgi:hypothetical protein
LSQVSYDISDEDLNDEDTTITPIKKSATRTYFHWTLVEKFEDEDEAYDKLRETNWKFKQNTQSYDGDQSFFKCGENAKCKAGYQFLYSTKDMSISAFTNNVSHDHSWDDSNNWGIPQNIKKVFCLE